jgi:hypothetical protein
VAPQAPQVAHFEADQPHPDADLVELPDLQADLVELPDAGPDDELTDADSHDELTDYRLLHDQRGQGDLRSLHGSADPGDKLEPDREQQRVEPDHRLAADAVLQQPR